MKKLLYFFIFTTIVALASCAQDDTVVPEVESDFNVSFEVSTTTDETDPQAVRAYNDGKKIRDLEYAIYKKEADGTYKFIKAVDAKNFFSADSQSGSFNEKLGYKKTYVIMLWADCTDDNYILNWSRENINDCTAAIYQKDKLVSQDDNADAFFAKVEFVADESNKSIDLTRPFAQINVCTDDYDAAVTRGFTASTTGMKVNAYTSLNLFSGAVGDKQDITFAFAALPSGEDASLDGYRRIAMNYLFAPAENEDTSITFYANNTNNSLTWNNIGIARNRRTNICGSLLSDNSDWDVYYFRIKALTWNVSNQMDDYSTLDGARNLPLGWDDGRRNAVAKFIAEQAPDVMFLQEMIVDNENVVDFMVDAMKQLDASFTKTGAASDYVTTYQGSKYTGKWADRNDPVTFSSLNGVFVGEEGVAVIYNKTKYDEVSSGRFWLNDIEPSDPKQLSGTNNKRNVMWIRLKEKQSGKQFVVASTHFDNTYTESILKMQAVILGNNLPADHRSGANRDNLPVFFGGDLNSNYDLTGTAISNLSSTYNYANLRRTAQSQGQPFYYPSGSQYPTSTMVNISESWGTFTTTQNGSGFDHLFMLRCKTFEYIQIHDVWGSGTIMSDHNPVSAIIQISAK